MKKVALHNLGCKVNSYELDVMQESLIEAGYEVVPFTESADIYIVNTCSVTNIADRKSRQMLHRAKEKNPEAVVVAVGCYVQTGKDILEKDPMVDLCVGNNRKKDIVRILKDYELKQSSEDTVIDINRPCEYESMRLTKTAEHTRAYIKIQDGCNQFCSYCIIPFARGRVRSRVMEDILEEVRGIAQTGYREIVLTGIHISSYGTDLQLENPLLKLLKELQQIQGIERIRLGSLEPRIITKEFTEELAKLSKICPHFHLSLQSGCDETLKRMNRHYTTQEYKNAVALLREAFVHPAITTDVIVGFPGETSEEFAATKDYLAEVKLYEMHIFRYSKRKGTKAATMPDQVNGRTQAERSNLLIALGERLSHEFRNYYHNKKVRVLWEEKKVIQGKTYWIGHTPEYVKYAVDEAHGSVNSISSGIDRGVLENDIRLLEPCTESGNAIK